MDKLKRMLAAAGVDPDILERASDEQIKRLAIPFFRMLEKEIASLS